MFFLVGGEKEEDGWTVGFNGRVDVAVAEEATESRELECECWL